MKTAILVLGSCVVLTTVAYTEEMHFKKTKQVVQKGDESEEKDVDLVFSTDEKKVIVKDRKYTEVFVTIPYDSIEEIVYERSTHPRTKTAILISPFALFSKGKKHWLTIQYKEGDSSEFVLLRLDKNEYQRIIATAEAQTGVDVERLTES